MLTTLALAFTQAALSLGCALLAGFMPERGHRRLAAALGAVFVATSGVLFARALR